jgi:prepilin-type N-terminal cleavage/methylation domain-containing protein
MNKPTRTNRKPYRGLTLVELLVSISLITVVSSMFLVAYRQAAAEASNIRTQSTIRKISEVLVSRMQEYENYPINFARGTNNFFANPVPGNATEAMPANNDEFEPKGILLERLRVMLLREIISGYQNQWTCRKKLLDGTCSPRTKYKRRATASCRNGFGIASGCAT